MFKEGMKEAGVDKDLKDVELTIISSGTTVQDQAIQEYFKQTWEDRLGVKVNVNICADTSLFVDERNNNRYDLVFMGWNGDYNDPMTFMELFNTGSGYAKSWVDIRMKNLTKCLILLPKKAIWKNVPKPMWQWRTI